jgi:hypothetical protein
METVIKPVERIITDVLSIRMAIDSLPFNESGMEYVAVKSPPLPVSVVGNHQTVYGRVP